MTKAQKLSEQEKAEHVRAEAREKQKQPLLQYYKEQRSSGVGSLLDEGYYDIARPDIRRRDVAARVERQVSGEKSDYTPRTRRLSLSGDSPAGNSNSDLSSPPGSKQPAVVLPVEPSIQQMRCGRGQPDYSTGRGRAPGRGRGANGPPQQPPPPSIARFQQQQQRQGPEEQPLQRHRTLQGRERNDLPGRKDFGIPRSASFRIASVTSAQKDEIRSLREKQPRKLGHTQGQQYTDVSLQKPSAIPQPKATVYQNPQLVNMNRDEPNERIRALRAQYDARQYHYPPSGIPQPECSMDPVSMAPSPVPTAPYARHHQYPEPQSLAHQLQQTNNERSQSNRPFDGYQVHGEYPFSGYSEYQQNNAGYPRTPGLLHAHTFNAGQAGSYQQADAFAQQLSPEYYSSQAVQTRIPHPLPFAPLRNENNRYPPFTPVSLVAPQSIHPYSHAADFYRRQQDLRPSYSLSHVQHNVTPRPPPATTTIIEDGIPRIVKNMYRPLKPVNPQIALVTEAMAPGYWNGRFSSAMDRMNELNPLLSDNSKKSQVMRTLVACCKSQDATNSYWAWRSARQC